ncbi:MAG: VWA domain-containing protein [Oscillospiraceae bacterium]|nr:VWA domain-containing protein [Oscillospiraceae bacterium]
MSESQQDPFYIDIVICLDASESMARYIDQSKQTMLELLNRLVDTLEEQEKEVAQLRVKVIAFRDCGRDGEPMAESAFFTLPEQYDAFRDYLDAVELKGGGGAQNGLEAIALALRSDWTTGKEKLRHIVWVFSADAALPLGARADSPRYPDGMPKSMEEFFAWWEGTGETFDGPFEPNVGRLLAFVPQRGSWAVLDELWQALTVYSLAGNELDEADLFFAVTLMAAPV